MHIQQTYEITKHLLNEPVLCHSSHSRPTNSVNYIIWCHPCCKMYFITFIESPTAQWVQNPVVILFTFACKNHKNSYHTYWCFVTSIAWKVQPTSSKYVAIFQYAVSTLGWAYYLDVNWSKFFSRLQNFFFLVYTKILFFFIWIS